MTRGVEDLSRSIGVNIGKKSITVAVCFVHDLKLKGEYVVRVISDFLIIC